MPTGPSSSSLVSDPPKEQRRLTFTILVALIALTVAPVLITALRAAPTWIPTGDTAIIVLRAGDVGGAESPLVGMPTTLSESIGREVHHPGPSEFWALWLPTLPFGSTAAALFTIALVNALWLGAAVYWASRLGEFGVGGSHLGGLPAGAVAAGIIVLSVGGSSTSVLVDPWNPYVALPALACYLVSAVAVLVRRRWALPWMVVSGSFAAQAHLSVAPIVLAVALAAIAIAGHHLVRLLRSGGSVQRAGDDERRIVGIVKAWRWPLVAATGIGALLWLPVMIDQLFGAGNLAAIAGAGRVTPSSAPTVGLRAGWDKVIQGVTAPPAFIDGNGWATKFPVGNATWRALFATVIFAGGAVVIVRWRRRHPSVAAALFVALVALLTGVFVMGRLPQTAFQAFKGHNELWLRAASGLLWGALTVAAVIAVQERRARPIQAKVRTAAKPIALAVIALLALMPAIRPIGVEPSAMVPAAQAAQRLPALLDRSRVYVIDGGDDLDAFSVAASLVLALDRAGVAVRVPDKVAASYGRRRSEVPADATRLTVVSAEGQTTPPSPTSTLVLTIAPDPTALQELRDAEATLERQVRQAGGIDLRTPNEHLSVDAANTLIRDGSIRGLVFFGRVIAPEISQADIDRLAQARAGPIRSISVYQN